MREDRCSVFWPKFYQMVMTVSILKTFHGDPLALGVRDRNI